MAKRADFKAILTETVSLTPHVFGIGIDINALTNAILAKPKPLDDKVERATAALREASALVSELEAAIETEVGRVTALKEEYAKYKSLASIEEDAAKALVIQLQESLGQGRSKERVIALLINFGAGMVVFLIGVLLSPLITGALRLE